MKKIFTVCVAAVLAGSLLAGCGKKEDTTDIIDNIRTGNTVNYDTAGAYVGTLLEQITLDGSITTPYTMNLSFTRMSGKIASINVHEDQLVNKGDIIATLDPTELEDEIVIQELTLNSAQSTYDNLVAQHAGSDEIEFAKIALETEQYKYDKLVEKRGFLELRAPFDGRITSISGTGMGRQYKVGSQINQNTTFCTISDSSKVCLSAVDYSNQLSNVSFGTRVDIRQGALASATGKVVDTIVSEFSSRGDTFTLTNYIIQVDGDVEFSDLGGIEVIFTTLRRDDAVIVPANAVFEATEMFGDDKTGATSNYVNVLVNGIKIQTPVTVGVISGDKAEILSGLEGGETVILP